jgi:CrcB protein
MHGLALVALGGALGASARYGIGLAAARLFGTGFPWCTLFVNIVGGLAMGVLIGTDGHDRTRVLLLGTGVLGGFTTFSAFSLETILMIERSAFASAAAYVAASVGFSIAAVAAGLALGRSMAT